MNDLSKLFEIDLLDFKVFEIKGSLQDNAKSDCEKN